LHKATSGCALAPRNALAGPWIRGVRVCRLSRIAAALRKDCWFLTRRCARWAAAPSAP